MNVPANSDDRTSPDRWRDSAIHRAKVMKHILESEIPERSSICVLGAGQANDLNLKTLLQRFSSVTLVDLEGATLIQAANRQNVVEDPRLRLVRNIDVTGLDLASRFKPGDSDAQPFIDTANSYRLKDIGEPFDMVVSTCLLSQLVLAVVETLSPEHKSFVELVKAIRTQHFETMNGLLKPGGTGLLITDFVASDSLPALHETSDENLSQLLSDAIHNQNYFHGMNPVVLFQLICQPPLADQLHSQKILQPWRWNNSFRDYGITGLRFVKN